jgi:hypothetical protein
VGVAKVTDVPVDQWRYAEAIPADLLDRLSGAELRARCAYAAEHYRIAELTPQDISSLRAHAATVLRSIPVVDYIREQQRLNALRQEAAGQPWGWDMSRQLKNLRRSNAFPPSLISAVEAALHGRPSTPEAAGILGRWWPSFDGD